MKKAFILVASVLFLQINAQQDSLTQKDNLEPETLKNIVKTNVLAYSFRNINLTYERSINRWFSVSAGFNTMPSGNVPFLKTFVKGEEANQFKDIKIGYNSFTLETRFYLGKGFGRGFYIAPYYKNSNVKADQFTYELEYQNPGGNSTTMIPVKVSGKTTGNSAGLMIGSQWALGAKKNWIIDWWIIGAHYGKGKGEFTGVSPIPLTAAQQQALKNELENLDIPMVKYTVTTDSNGAYIKMDGPWAGLRSGLSVGYRF